MTKKQILRKSAILAIAAAIIPLIVAPKSPTPTLSDLLPGITESEQDARTNKRNQLSKLTPQLPAIPLKTDVAPIMVAQISVGTITIVLIGGVILIAVIIWKTKICIWIGHEEMGIAYKKFALNPSLRLPPGRIIALKGEAGIQAKVLDTGLNWGYPFWMYRVTKVPVITIGVEEIGIVEAKDGKTLEAGQPSGQSSSGQSFGRVVDCKDFQDIEAFFAHQGQKGKQQAILTTGTYRTNTAMFSIRKAAVTKIGPQEIGLVEAKDGSPLKSGRNFGRRVNCQYFQNPQAFFEQGGNTGKQIEILPPGTYQINTDLFEVRKVPITHIGTEQIGLVEAYDGASLTPGQSFGKIVDCDNFQDGAEFLRKGGQRGKQQAILPPGDYRINTQLFTIRQVPITKIAPDELGLVEATEGNPLKQGQ
ncbi:MAG: hypothetical protein F6K41_29580, partial [Symploca sp. SIO3E6]|nr:hypothetical protein [Caldora sp. SIO3E6]